MNVYVIEKREKREFAKSAKTMLGHRPSLQCSDSVSRKWSTHLNNHQNETQIYVHMAKELFAGLEFFEMYRKISNVLRKREHNLMKLHAEAF